MTSYNWWIHCDLGLRYFHLLLCLKFFNSFLQILLIHRLLILRIVDIWVKLQWLGSDYNVRIVVDHGIHLAFWGWWFLKNAIFFKLGTSDRWLFFSTGGFLFIKRGPEHPATRFFDGLDSLRNIDWGGFVGGDNWVLVRLYSFFLAVFNVFVIISRILVLVRGVIGGVLMFALNLLETLFFLVDIVWDIFLGIKLVT